MEWGKTRPGICFVKGSSPQKALFEIAVRKPLVAIFQSGTKSRSCRTSNGHANSVCLQETCCFWPVSRNSRTRWFLAVANVLPPSKLICHARYLGFDPEFVGEPYTCEALIVKVVSHLS